MENQRILWVMSCVHRWMHCTVYTKVDYSWMWTCLCPCALSNRTEMNISVCSIKACRSRSQRTRLASLKLHLYSTEAFICCTYHKTAISANIAAASDRALRASLHPLRVIAAERQGDFTPSSKLLSFDTCKGSWDYGSGGLCMLCLLYVRSTQWLNYKEWCTEAAEVSCFAAEPCNECFTSKADGGVKEQMVWFWILLFIGSHINPG